MTVAAPVSEVRPTSLTGLYSVPVKYPVRARIAEASTMPMTTATDASSAGLPDVWVTPTTLSSVVMRRNVNLSKLVGR